MKPRIVFTRAADRDFRAISDRPLLRRLSAAIESLRNDPHPPHSRKLAGFDRVWRIRVGDYRICYAWREGELVILILTVARRAHVYELLRRRLR